MTRKTLTATMLTTLLFVNILSANVYQDKAKALINSTSLAATDLGNYVKAHPVFSLLVAGTLMGTHRIKNSISFAEEHPYLTSFFALATASTQVK